MQKRKRIGFLAVCLLMLVCLLISCGKIPEADGGTTGTTAAGAADSETATPERESKTEKPAKPTKPTKPEQTEKPETTQGDDLPIIWK